MTSGLELNGKARGPQRSVLEREGPPCQGGEDGVTQRGAAEGQRCQQQPEGLSPPRLGDTSATPNFASSPSRSGHCVS